MNASPVSADPPAEARPAVAAPQENAKPAPSAAQLLASIERAEGIFQTYVARSVIDFFDDGQKQKSMSLLLAVTIDSSLAVMKSPAYDQGKVVLVNEDGYFLYFPTPDRYIRVSPQNSVYGNISYGDIVRPPLLKYYSLTSSQIDGDKADLTFELKPDVKLPYFRKVVHFDVKNNAISGIDSFSRSGVMLGKTVNLEFTDIRGVRLPTYSKIFDVRKPQSYAFQRNSSIKAGDLPGAFFTPSFLREVDSYFDRRLGMN